MRADNAKEFEALKPWAAEQGIEMEFAEPYTPAQNGVALWLNRSLIEMTRAILIIDANVPKTYWPWARAMANYAQNRTVFKRETKKTPSEI
jgi:transposase InsO family protein